MNDKKQAENTVPSVDNTVSKENDLISSEDVLAVISGDQVALVEQMERAKEAALKQKDNVEELAAEKAKKKLEEEEKKKKAIMDEVKRRKEEAQRREQQAREEAERKKAAIEAERQRQLAEAKRLEEEAKAKAEQVRKEAERKKQEKEALLRAQEEEKKAKVQARIDAKNAKIAEREALKQSKVQARLNAKKAKEDAKLAKAEAKKAKAQARIDARNKKNSSKTSKEVKATPSVAPSSAVSKPSTPVPSPLPSSKVNTKDKDKTVPSSLNKKESNFKYYMTFIFFVLLILMVIFLPEISSFVSDYFSNKNQEVTPELTTGTLTCTMNTNDDKYDYYYETEFNFRDSKMYRLTFTTTIKGDQRLDAVELSEKQSSCELLKQQTATLTGINVSCSLSNGVYENEQKLDYETLKVDDVTTAYLEAGGTYPNYKYEQNIDEIEKEMNASNYTCKRHS